MTAENFDADAYKDKLREQGMREDILDDLVDKKKASLSKSEDNSFEYVMKLETVGMDADHIIVAGFASGGNLDYDSEAVNQDSLRSAWDEYMTNPVLRYMHGKDARNPDAIGQVIPEYVTENGNTLKTEFRDGKPFIVAKISNAPDVESIRTKIKEGVLKGFSIGGRANRVTEFCTKIGKNINRIFVNRLSEISIVDLPANKNGIFEVVKGCVGNNCMCSIDESLDEVMKSDDERPSKAWWDNCISTAKDIDGIKDPEAFCGWMYKHGEGAGFGTQKKAIGKSEVSNYEGTNVPEDEKIEYIKTEEIDMSENIEMEMGELKEFVKSTVSEMIAEQDQIEKAEAGEVAVKEALDLRARIAELEAKVAAQAAALKAAPQEAMKSEEVVEEIVVEDVEKSEVDVLKAEIAELKVTPLYKAEQTEAVEKGETTETSHLGSIISAVYGGN